MNTIRIIFAMACLVGCSPDHHDFDIGETGETWAPIPGELWGPCPTSEWGTIDLCNDVDLACVPAADGEANVCLQLHDCPADLMESPSKDMALGWGDACYPRCETDNDCAEGMVCSASVADGTSMCAWLR